MTHVHGSDAPAPPAPGSSPPPTSGALDAGPPPVPSWRLLLTLGGAGALAGLLIVTAYTRTLPRIEANKAAALARAVTEVLKSPARYDTLYLVNNTLVRQLPAGQTAKGLEAVYLGYDSAGTRLGFAISAAGNGFQDVISLIFGYEPTSKRLLALKILAHKDTPGLGDRIEKDTAYTSQFARAKAPLVPVKVGMAAPNDSTNVQTITGATISSKAVIKIINTAIERWTPLLAQVSK